MKMAAKPFSNLPKETYIAGFTLVAIALHLTLRYGTSLSPRMALLPLFAVLVIGGVPLVYELAKKLIKREFGSDLLAGVSIFTTVLLGQHLVASIVVLMLSGGEASSSTRQRKLLRCWMRWRSGCQSSRTGAMVRC